MATIDQTIQGRSSLTYQITKTITGMSRIARYRATLPQREIDAAVASGYVYFDLWDALQIHDFETTMMVCSKLDDFNRLDFKMMRGQAKRVWLMVPYGNFSSARECTYGDFQIVRDTFTQMWGANGVINKYDSNDSFRLTGGPSNANSGPS